MNMIEKVARAMYEHSRPVDSPLFDDLDDRFKIEFLQAVEAGIEAMREPTKQMIEAATNGPNYNHSLELTKEIWAKGIEAALKDK